MQPILTARELAPLDGREWRAYVMGLPFMYADYAPIKFVAYKIKAQNLERAADLPPANDGRKTIVVALPNNFPEDDKVKTRYRVARSAKPTTNAGGLCSRYIAANDD
ncbi:MAG: hypothetical protein IPO29_17360 [Anaerolineae bacterium]|nr:hypothetical protein [Anaerolineae bacterium]